MLVLARRVNESLMIGDDVEIVVVEIKGDQVKLGIKAPKSVPVYRQEIYLEIKEENKRAAQSQVAADQLANLDNLLKQKNPPKKPKS